MSELWDRPLTDYKKKVKGMRFGEWKKKTAYVELMENDSQHKQFHLILRQSNVLPVSLIWGEKADVR